MKIVKRIFQGFGIIIGMIVIYLSIVTFVPGFEVPVQPLGREAKITKEIDIDTACFFMFGFPTETEEEMRMTIDFAKKINPTYASFHMSIPYPETDLYKMMGKSKDLFPVCYEGEHSPEFLQKMIKKAYKEFYLRPAILPKLLKNPKFLWWQFKLFLSYTYLKS